MLRPIVTLNPIFAGTTRKDIEYSKAALTAAVNGLILQNEEWLRFYPNTPNIYDTNVRYKREKGTEIWKTIPYVIRDKSGDCEDLASWLGAQLRVRNHIKAMADVTVRYISEDDVWRAHARIILPNGRILDPSRKLGM